jgi:hypothetical protein
MNRALLAFVAVVSLVSGCATLPRSDDFGLARRDEQTVRQAHSRSDEMGMARRDEQAARMVTSRGGAQGVVSAAARR